MITEISQYLTNRGVGYFPSFVLQEKSNPEPGLSEQEDHLAARQAVTAVWRAWECNGQALTRDKFNSKWYEGHILGR